MPARRATTGMERRRLGRTDMVVSMLGFGGSEIGYQGASQRTVDRLLGSALDAGLNVIDTAECYADSETLIGTAVRERRRDVYVFTKCGHAAGWQRADWSPASLLASIERSLRRLRTDHVDLIQLHSCSLAELERGDVVRALEDARQRGWARYVGYSGDGAAARHAVLCGRFDTLQTSVSIADQEAIDAVLPLAAAREIGVIAKRPIANVAWRYARKPAEPYYQAYWSRLRALDYPFLRRDPGKAVATALRFTLSVPGVATAIVGTTKSGRWTENAAMLRGGPLPPREFDRIRARWRRVADASWEGQV
jgi:aryl-alcohol dehydrogenase-like predicted oxidoreductase